MNNDKILLNYKERSYYESNCLEFWSPVIDRVIPNVLENRYYISTLGRTYSIVTKRPFGLSTHRKGYYQYAFTTKDGKRITRKLHRVIMMTFAYFLGCENYEVNHIDGNKKNNELSNLEWCTSSENTIHAINNGLKTVFGNEYKVYLSNEQIEKILYLYNEENINDPLLIAYKLGLDLDDKIYILINNICHGYARIGSIKDINNK